MRKQPQNRNEPKSQEVMINNFLTLSRCFCFNSFPVVKLRDKHLSVGGNGEYLDARIQITPLEASSPLGFQQHPTLGPDECSN